MRAELADKYLKAHGMVVTRGAHKQQVFMPYIVMDKARELAAHSIDRLPLRHEARKWRNELKRVYHDFYSDFFRPYTQDEVNEIIESFDGFAANAPEAQRHNKHIERFERLTMKIGNAWYRGTGNTRTVAPDEIPALDRALSRYATKIANYNEQI